MSYTEAQQTGDNWYYATDSDDYYSPYDLAALNYLYGPDGLNGREGLVFIPPASGSAELTITRLSPHYNAAREKPSFFSRQGARRKLGESVLGIR